MSTIDRDFDDLRVGERFTTHGRTLTEADLVGFATLTGDMHPQHTDAEWARRGRFRGRIAHGLLVLSYAAGLVRFDPGRVVALRRVADATFKRPVLIGDTIRVEGELIERRPQSDELGLALWRWRIVNQRDRLVAKASVEVVWRRGAATVAGDGELEPLGQPVLL